MFDFKKLSDPIDKILDVNIYLVKDRAYFIREIPELDYHHIIKSIGIEDLKKSLSDPKLHACKTEKDTLFYYIDKKDYREISIKN